jgi:hypothetical protein
VVETEIASSLAVEKFVATFAIPKTRKARI